MRRLDLPKTGPFQAEKFVAAELSHLFSGDVAASPRFRGGPTAASQALNNLDIEHYASARYTAFPETRRGATRLSPYINSGLLTLRQIWDAVTDASPQDKRSYRNELLWQEYARHWLALLGERTLRGTKRELEASDDDRRVGEIDRQMGCIDSIVTELEDDGWLVNETRLWFASYWVGRLNRSWQSGAEYFMSHLLDGSVAANRLGWQWASGVGSERLYQFTRWQVEERAQGLCASCELVNKCPIERPPPESKTVPVADMFDSAANSDIESWAGPAEPQLMRTPEVVWLSPESLGPNDPALLAHDGLKAVFVFDEPHLLKQNLSAKRLLFWVEALAELAQSREVELWSGDPQQVLEGKLVASTYIPQPRWRETAQHIDLGSVHPWPWLVRPNTGRVNSFSAWRKDLGTEIGLLETNGGVFK